MKKKFRTYLQSIELPKVLHKRVETICGFYNEACKEQIGDIFISDYIEQNGERKYGSLWLFSKKYTMEARDFASIDDFDFLPIDQQVIYWHIKKTEYDFKNTTNKSRCSLEFRAYRIDCELKATKNNCDYLKIIFNKYIVPNIVS